MDIKRFDGLEFNVIKVSTNGMYSLDDEYKERALILMKEGILKKNPVDNWPHSGWKLTPVGEKYYDEFLAKVRARHGHEWLTNRESNPDLYDEDDERGKKLNIFALSYGYHNGMECKKCGYSFCMHCTSEFEVDECTRKEPVVAKA